MQALNGPVLAAINLTGAADETVRQASALAEDLDARLVVCHVLPETFRVRMPFPQSTAVDPATQMMLERRARDAVQARVEAVAGRAGSQFDIVLDSGSPHAGILTQADSSGAGMIVVGPGPVAQRVARYASTPVIVARASAHGCVLGATDFSDPSLPAIDMAVSEAIRRQTALRVIHCLDILLAPTMNPEALAGVSAVSRSVMEEHREGASRQLRASLSARHADGEAVVVEGLPAVEIIEAVRSTPTELVVVGSRGRTGLWRILLGSVAEAVLSAAPCSVLVVRLDPPRPGE